MEFHETRLTFGIHQSERVHAEALQRVGGVDVIFTLDATRGLEVAFTPKPIALNDLSSSELTKYRQT